jgi:hypothetical protein
MSDIRSKYATVNIGEFKDIPLIGVPPSATEETCSKCGKPQHLSEMAMDEGGNPVCNDCRKSAFMDQYIREYNANPKRRKCPSCGELTFLTKNPSGVAVVGLKHNPNCALWNDCGKPN